MNSSYNMYASIIVLLYVVAVTSSWNLLSKNNEILFRNLSRHKRQLPCGDDAFPCRSGECILADKECDGSADCRDGSDETDICKRIKCASYSFTCKYGACINGDFECDGKQDCRDNSDEETKKCERITSCGSDQFQCKNGQCIDDFYLCDGKKDCTDGSDETAEICKSIICPTYAYQCLYGACVNVTSKCNKEIECADGSDEVGCDSPTISTPPPRPFYIPRPFYTPRPVEIPKPRPTPRTLEPPTKGGCILPFHPAYGEFKIMAETNLTYTENIATDEYTTIQLYCNGSSVTDAENTVTICLEGHWSPDLQVIGGCIRTCSTIPNDTDSYTVQCIYNNNIASCMKPKVGTRANVKCKNYFEDATVRPIITCQDGSWNYPITPCTPECGNKRVGVQTLIIGGSKALKGEYPWLVGIYYSSNKKLLCGGSIISRHYVLSAAHCFTTDRGVPFSKDDYLVAAGKYYRTLDDDRDKDKQIVEIEQIHIPQGYKGVDQSYAADYAVLKLKRPFDLSLDVQPVCVDWTNKYESSSFKQNELGVVAGWGDTQPGSSASEVLKKLSVPFKLRRTCEEHMPKEFVARYYTYDKFCAGYIENKTSICTGDSGGGLYFPNHDFKFFVRGIVSLSTPRGSGCDSISIHCTLKFQTICVKFGR